MKYYSAFPTAKEKKEYKEEIEKVIKMVKNRFRGKKEVIQDD